MVSGPSVHLSVTLVDGDDVLKLDFENNSTDN